MSAVRRAIEVVLCIQVLGFLAVLAVDFASALLVGRFLGPEGQMLAEMVYRRGALGDFVGYVSTAVWLTILPLWMVMGGATSGLWNKWPLSSWGSRVRSKLGRWLLVGVVEVVEIWAVIDSIRSAN